MTDTDACLSGRHGNALQHARLAVESGPRDACNWQHLGLTLLQMRQYDEADVAFRHAVAIDDACSVAWNCTGMLACRRQCYQEAESCFIKAIEARPDDTAALCNFASSLKLTGRIDEAAVLLAPAVDALPGDLGVQWVAAVLANYRPDLGCQDVLRQHERFAAALEKSVGQPAPMPHRDHNSSGGPLRVGFLSPDMRRHSVAHFLLPLIRAMDRSRFTVLCYSLADVHDEITALFQLAADGWRDSSALSDTALVSRIRSDEVDVLIDCAGLFEGARPAVLAMRAAPLQVAWLGYPSGLGLKSIHCRMLDAWSSPLGAEGDPMSDGIALIDGCFLAYDPLADEPLPQRNAYRNAPVTFGCFNDSSKWNPVMLDQWGQLLREVAGSRLLLKARALECAEVCGWVHAEFAARGIGKERLELRGFVGSQAAHRAMYGDVDIALDTFPYHGVTSTCEALWMGVPVVTLLGEAHAGRAGASLLHAAGHPEWVAASFEEYRGIAGSLAADRGRLALLQAMLREPLRGSQLFDTRGFARRFELALQRIRARANHLNPRH